MFSNSFKAYKNNNKIRKIILQQENKTEQKGIIL